MEVIYSSLYLHSFIIIKQDELCLCFIQTLVSDGHNLMQNTPDILVPSVPVGTVVDVRQSDGSLHRVSGQSHAAQSLYHPALILHVCRSTIDARKKGLYFQGCNYIEQRRTRWKHAE